MIDNISDLIVDVARKEDRILRRIGKGVLLMPELAFAYIVGKELASKARSIFGTDNVSWKPENMVTNESGITDLVFEVKQGKNVAIEFKIGGHQDNYKKDIEKLKNIPDNYEKIFCALIDAWPNNIEKDTRVQAVESQEGVNRICRDNFFDYFTTIHEEYKGQLCCIVGIWHVQKH